MSGNGHDKSIFDQTPSDASQKAILGEVPHIVTEQEITQLAEALHLARHHRSQGTPTEDDLRALVLWATGAKLAYILFSEIIAGNLDVDIENGEPYFVKHEEVVKGLAGADPENVGPG